MSLQDPQPSDEMLVTSVAEQDIQAFERLYDRYSRAVYLLATYMVGTEQAEEMVQDVFMRLWHKADQFDATRGSFAAWFMTIARNHIRATLKQHRDHNKIVLAEVEQLLADTPDEQPQIEDMVGRYEQQRELYDGLMQLPPEQRRALVMAYFGGLSQSAIASELDLPLGTVKKRIRLGLRKLRAFLHHLETEVIETEKSEKHYDRS